MLDHFKPAKVLLLGDFMLDVYTIGSVHRISPEAPVPVLRVEKEERRAGGAGNAALNLISLGMEVVTIGRVGNDAAGMNLMEALAEEGVDVRGCVIDPSFQTTIKTRMIADTQQLLRVDTEKDTPLGPELEKKILEMLPSLLTGVDVVAISDYGKGLLSRKLLAETIEKARQANIPIIVDPKGIDFAKYRGVSVLKPNLGEAFTAAGLGHEVTLDAVGEKLLRSIDVKTLMVTRSKEGISLFSSKGREDFPAVVHEVKDVTGAGDTVLAVMTAALANRLDLGFGAQVANIAAGLAIERIGCARISLAEIAARLVDVKNGAKAPV